MPGATINGVYTAGLALAADKAFGSGSPGARGYDLNPTGEEALRMITWTREDAHRYLDRWRLVEEQEISELQNTPMETKARQLAALMASWELFGEDPEREKGVREVRARWARIRKALGG